VAEEAVPLAIELCIEVIEEEGGEERALFWGLVQNEQFLLSC